MIRRFEEFTKNIAMANKYIVKIKSYKMNKFGLKASNVMCLFFLGKNLDGLTPTELCEMCGEDKAGISKSLFALKEKGYVFANDDGDKKYKVKYTITEKGKKAYEEISEFIVKAVDRAGGSLTEEERTLFYKTLGTIVSNIGEFCKELDI